MDEKSQGARQGGTGTPHRTAVDLMDREPTRHHIIPVWFFVGVILLLYGAIICLTGIYELSHSPSTVLGHLHPAIWWGALLAVIGGIYVWLFLPRKP